MKKSMIWQRKLRSKILSRVLCALGFALIAVNLCGCENRTKPVILWTDKREFVSYVELFNSLQEDVSVLVVYKENIARNLPAAKDVVPPDIVVSSWLKNSRVKHNFANLDHLFSEMMLDRKTFYPQLLDCGKIDAKLYLLPVSFNLPAVIFASKNRDKISDDYVISLDEIKSTGSAYNKKNKSGLHTAMGFAPRWDSDFLYLAQKLRNANFHVEDGELALNRRSFEDTVVYLRNWTLEANGSSAAEDDFKFKYLYTPFYTLVTQDRCLFASTTSDRLFNINPEKLQDIDYRWIHEKRSIPAEDDIVQLGLYRKSKNINAAEKFIIWFMQEESQKAMLERSASMKLNTTTFGIAGGFSSIQNVNLRTFPLFYPMLLRNLPLGTSIQAPAELPERWQSLKERVIIPYMQDALNTRHESSEKSFDQYLAEWKKQYF